jgi:crotonobetainyl-CoA:carnitine CoA-transferase CaiB-like acyl-CoA transferase
LPHLDELDRTLPFPPTHGEHTDAVLIEAGFDPERIAALHAAGVI